MKVPLLTATVLSLGIIAGSTAAQAASGRISQNPGLQGGDNNSSTSTKGTASSGKEDNPGYLTGPLGNDVFNSDYGMQPTPYAYDRMQPRSYGFGGYMTPLRTPCKAGQLRHANGACHAIGPT